QTCRGCRVGERSSQTIARERRNARPVVRSIRLVADQAGGNMAGRNVYLVGSVPMASAEDVFERVSAALGPRIKRIPDGETGNRSVGTPGRGPFFADNPAFRKSGEFFRVHASGRGRERYTLNEGYAPADVRFDNLFYADIAEESYAVFRRL